MVWVLCDLVERVGVRLKGLAAIVAQRYTLLHISLNFLYVVLEILKGLVARSYFFVRSGCAGLFLGNKRGLRVFNSVFQRPTRHLSEARQPKIFCERLFSVFFCAFNLFPVCFRLVLRRLNSAADLCVFFGKLWELARNDWVFQKKQRVLAVRLRVALKRCEVNQVVRVCAVLGCLGRGRVARANGFARLGPSANLVGFNVNRGAAVTHNRLQRFRALSNLCCNWTSAGRIESFDDLANSFTVAEQVPVQVRNVVLRCGQTFVRPIVANSNVVVRGRNKLFRLLFNAEQVLQVRAGKGVVSGLLNNRVWAKTELLEVELQFWSVSFVCDTHGHGQPCVELLEVRGVVRVVPGITLLG